MGTKQIGYTSRRTKDDTTHKVAGFAVQYNDDKKGALETTSTNAEVTTEEVNVESFEAPKGYKIYHAKDGDTFASLAKEYDTTEEELKNVNSDIDGEISKDDVVYVPESKDKVASGAAGGGSGGGGSQGGGGSGGSGGSNISSDKEESTKEDGASSDGGSEYSNSTDDLRELNLDEFQTIYETYKADLESLLQKYGLTGGTFTKIYDFASQYARENGLAFNTDEEIATAIDAYLKSTGEYGEINFEDLKEMVLAYNLVTEMEDNGYTVSDNGSISDYSEDIINSILIELGIDENKIEEMSTLDIVSIINENRDKASSIMNELLFLPEDYDIDSIISSYIVNHYMSLLPQDADYDVNELLDKFQEEAIDILSRLGMNTESLYEENVFDLIKKLYENEDKINKLFNDAVPNMFEDYYGFKYLFTMAMDSLAFQIAGDSEENLNNYINSKDFSKDTIKECMDYYNNGNTVSALYTLKLEETKNTVKEYDDRIADIHAELTDLLYKTGYVGQEDIYTFADKMEEEYGETEITIQAKELLDELDSCKLNRNEMASQIDQMRTIIIENSFQYLDDVRDTSDYSDAVEASNGIITANVDFLHQIDKMLESGKTINIQDINMDSNFASDLLTVSSIIPQNSSYFDDAELLKSFLQSDFNTYFTGATIENVTIEDNIIIVRVLKNGVFVDVKYDINDESTMYDFEYDGKKIFSTDDPNEYCDVNYFELFEYIKSKDEYKDMTNEEMLTKVFGWSSDDMLEYKDTFNMAELTYIYMDEENIDDYRYLYQVEGKDRAKEYLECLRNRIHQEMGFRAASEDVEYIMSGNEIINTAIVGLNNGANGWIDNVYAFLTSDTTMTPTEYESKFLLEIFTQYSEPVDIDRTDLTVEEKDKIKDVAEPTFLDYYYAKGEITKDQYDNIKSNELYQEFYSYTKEHPKAFNRSYSVGQSVGNMLPSVIASYLVAPLGGVSIAGHFLGAGQAAAGISMFAGAYGGEYKDKIRSGYDELTSRTYATLSALSEVATEYFLGRIPGVARVSETVNPVVATTFKQLLAMRGINVLKDVAGELIEESVQIWIGYALDKGILGEDIDLSKWPKEELDTIIVTTFTTLILGIPANAKNLISDVTNGPLIKINENESVKLSFKQIYELNQKYVDSETGTIDIEGLMIEVNKLLGRTEGTSIETQTIRVNPNIDVDGFLSEHAVDMSDSNISDWIRDGLTSELSADYGVDTSGIDTSGSVVFLNGEDFQKMFGANVSGTVVDGKVVINLDAAQNVSYLAKKSSSGLSLEQLQELYLQDTIYHEFLHLASQSDSNTGLTEAMIEYMTAHRNGNSIYQETGVYLSGYMNGVKALELLVDRTSLTTEDIVDAYNSNDMSKITSKIESALEGSGYDADTILKLINTATLARNTSTQIRARKFIEDILDGKDVNIPDSYLEEIGNVVQNSEVSTLTEQTTTTLTEQTTNYQDTCNDLLDKVQDLYDLLDDVLNNGNDSSENIENIKEKIKELKKAIKDLTSNQLYDKDAEFDLYIDSLSDYIKELEEYINEDVIDLADLSNLDDINNFLISENNAIFIKQKQNVVSSMIDQLLTPGKTEEDKASLIAKSMGNIGRTELESIFSDLVNDPNVTAEQLNSTLSNFEKFVKKNYSYMEKSKAWLDYINKNGQPPAPSTSVADDLFSRLKAIANDDCYGRLTSTWLEAYNNSISTDVNVKNAYFYSMMNLYGFYDPSMTYTSRQLSMIGDIEISLRNAIDKIMNATGDFKNSLRVDTFEENVLSELMADLRSRRIGDTRISQIIEFMARSWGRQCQRLINSNFSVDMENLVWHWYRVKQDGTQVLGGHMEDAMRSFLAEQADIDYVEEDGLNRNERRLYDTSTTPPTRLNKKTMFVFHTSYREFITHMVSIINAAYAKMESDLNVEASNAVNTILSSSTGTGTDLATVSRDFVVDGYTYRVVICDRVRVDSSGNVTHDRFVKTIYPVERTSEAVELVV